MPTPRRQRARSHSSLGDDNNNEGEEAAATTATTTPTRTATTTRARRRTRSQSQDDETQQAQQEPKSDNNNEPKNNSEKSPPPRPPGTAGGGNGGGKKKKGRNRRKNSNASLSSDGGVGVDDPAETEAADNNHGTDINGDEQHRGAPQTNVVVSKPAPTVDIAVHRVRYLQYRPKSVLCARAFRYCAGASDNDDDRNSEEVVAVSREDGSVELRSANEKLRTVARVAGFPQRQVNVMAWICGSGGSSSRSGNDSTGADTGGNDSFPPTLVGASKDGTLFAVDFSAGTLSSVIASGGGGVFALASLCCRRKAGGGGSCGCSSSRRPCPQLVAAGCEDGSVRIFRLVRDHLPLQRRQPSLSPSLELVSVVPTTGAAVLSLAWQIQSSSKNSACTTLYAGVADGTIRRIDSVSSDETQSSSDHVLSSSTSTMTWKSALRMTVESYGRPTPTRVWALEALADGTVVSADSLGHVQFWDGNFGTLLQSFDQNDVKADVLGLAVTEDECKVFASGVDSRVVCIERQPIVAAAAVSGALPADSKKWTLSHAQRPHTHDVNALAIVRQRTRGSRYHHGGTASSVGQSESLYREVLCTGGMDTKLCTYLVDNFRKKRPRTVYPWAPNLVSVAKKARLLIMMRQQCVDVYRLGDKCDALENLPVTIEPEKTHLGRIELKSTSNLVCAAISDDGNYLALSDSLSIMLFALEFVDGGTSLQPTKLKLEGAEDHQFSASALCFNDSSDRIFMACSDNAIRVVSVRAGPEISQGESPTVATVTQSLVLNSTVSSKRGAPIHEISVSQDEGYIFTARNLASGSMIELFKADTDKEFHRWWKIPALDASPSAVAFLTGSSARIAVACVNFAVYVFDVEERRLHPWSESVEHPLHQSLPPEFHRLDYPVRIVVSPGSPNKFLVVSL